MKIKKCFLILAFVAVSVIALLYGVSPRWFAQTFLSVPETVPDVAHILRAVMCLYLAFGLFWLSAAFSDKYRSVAVLTIIVFAGGLFVGRCISFIADGRPSPILLIYAAIEFTILPIAWWIFKLPE
jgi:Na+-driven multidrug efflux pump